MKSGTISLSPSYSSTIAPSAAETSIPTVLITSSHQSVTYVNPQNIFILTGEVMTKVVCTSVWAVNTNSTSFSLSTAAASPLISSIPAGTTNFAVNIVIRKYSLPPTSTLIFLLSCGLSSASIVVTTNGPPTPGLFKALPYTGVELSTVFNFSAANYIDPDLPLTYQFGFINNGVRNVLQSRSLLFISYSYLAAGAVTSFVQVFDSYGVYIESTAIAIVSKQQNQQLLQESLLSALHASKGDSEATQNALVLASAVLNQVSCDKAATCDRFHRSQCSKVTDTCGACKTGFIGDSGDSNSICVDLNAVKSNSSSSNSIISRYGCSRDSDCALFELCDASSRSCWLPSKTCLNDCSSPSPSSSEDQGSCLHVNVNTNILLKDCKVTDSTCQARCNCYGNFTGSDCSISKYLLIQRQALRSEMLTGLKSVLSSSRSFVSDNLGSLSDTLSSLTGNVYEVSPNMVTTINQVALSVLTSASQSNATVKYDALSGILSSVNTIMQVSSIHNQQSTQMLNLFSDLISSQLVPGEDSVNYIYDSFRMKVVSASVNPLSGGQLMMTIEAPQTAMEAAFGSQSASSVSIQQTHRSDDGNNRLIDLSVSMIVTTASSYGLLLAAKMNSNPVQLKLSSSSSIENTEIVFTLIHNSEKEFTNASYAARMGFNSTCYGPLDHAVYNYTCPESHDVLVHSCDGRQGVLTSYCRILAPRCALVDSSSGDIDSASSRCVVIEFTKSNTTCKCTTVHSQMKRRLDRNVAIDTVLNVVSTSLYIANDMKDTFSSAGQINSLAALKRVLIVIVMFSSMWAIGLLLIFGCIWRRKYMLKVNVLDAALIERKRRVAQVTYSVAVVQQNLLNYTAQVIPSIFSNEPIFRRIWSEISRHHRYLALMTASKGESGDKQRILTCIQLLSVQTMLMFLLALLYDLQGPSDDGTCTLNLTKINCLSRKSTFDRTQSFCAWSESNASGVESSSFLCVYQDPKFTIETVLIIAVIVSLMVALFTKPIDMIFDLLTAPVADDLKISQSNTGTFALVTRRMSNIARRMSSVATNAASAAISSISSTKNLLVGITTRKIPHNTDIAYKLATASMSVLASTSIQQLQERQLSRMRTYYHHQNKTSGVLHDSDDDDDDSHSDRSESSDESSYSSERDEIRNASNPEDKREGGIVVDVMTNLSREIACQRRLLKSCELELFDEQWGIDPTGEFATGDRRFFPCMKHRDGAFDIISQQLKLVEEEVNKKSEKLKIATDAHTGLEILHLFIKDLLGRSTPAAIIFETKADEDFKHTEVVTRMSKRLAMLALAGINIFFVYFAILTGFRRGVSWQQSYLIACIIQFTVEIFLNETMECIWIQCAIPLLVSGEIRRVGDSITEIISDLCSSDSKESRLFLNAPDYLFVSTNLAKKFPRLMESIVVQSYFSHMPGELSQLWNVGSVARIRRYHSLRHITLLTTILTLIQYCGTAPFILHRIFIRFMQPFVFAGFALLWSMIISSPVYIALISSALGALIIFSIFKYFHNTSSNTLSPITPVVDEANNDISSGVSVIDEDNPIIVHLDMNDFHKTHDGKDSSAEDSSSNDLVGCEVMSDDVVSRSSHSSSSRSFTFIEFSTYDDKSIIKVDSDNYTVGVKDSSKNSYDDNDDDDLSSVDSSALMQSTVTDTDNEKL